MSGAQANHWAWPRGVLGPVIKSTGEHVGEETHMNLRSCVHTVDYGYRATDIYGYCSVLRIDLGTAYSVSPEWSGGTSEASTWV